MADQSTDLTPFNGTSNGDAVNDESDNATAGFPVRPGAAPVEADAAAAGVIAVETERRNLL